MQAVRFSAVGFRTRQRKAMGLLLRLGGFLLVGIAWLAISHACALAPMGQHLEGTVVEYCLSAAAFLCASSGSALLIVGPHLLDEIEIAERWKARRSVQ